MKTDLLQSFEKHLSDAVDEFVDDLEKVEKSNSGVREAVYVDVVYCCELKSRLVRLLAYSDETIAAWGGIDGVLDISCSASSYIVLHARQRRAR
jgi:hypothetical protein